MRDTLREALTTAVKGPKVIIAQSECMLNKQRRVRPLMRKRMEGGERVVRERFGVDPDTCTGDHSCIRLSGCPSLTLAPNPDPLRREPVTKVINSCVGCGLCGEVAHAAVLCPSFYRASIIANPTRWDRLKDKRARRRDRLAAAPHGRPPGAHVLAGARWSRSLTTPMDAQSAKVRPITIAVLALGGEGGGVLADWIVDLANHGGYLAQATSVPGRRPAHRRDDLLSRAVPQERRAGGRARPGAGPDAGAGRRRRGAGVRADGRRRARSSAASSRRTRHCWSRRPIACSP